MKILSRLFYCNNCLAAALTWVLIAYGVLLLHPLVVLLGYPLEMLLVSLLQRLRGTQWID